jgi:hypothetical protein
MKENHAFFERGHGRAVLENVTPRVDAGRHPFKQIVGERTAGDWRDHFKIWHT